MILADTSAWIEFLRATGSGVHLWLAELLASKQQIAVTDIVLMEILAGARDDGHRESLRRLLAGCDYLATEGPADYEGAADLYRRCRKAGATVRGLPDCLIAVVAMRHDVAILHADRDFDAISRCVALGIARI